MISFSRAKMGPSLPSMVCRQSAIFCCLDFIPFFIKFMETINCLDHFDRLTFISTSEQDLSSSFDGQRDQTIKFLSCANSASPKVGFDTIEVPPGHSSQKLQTASEPGPLDNVERALEFDAPPDSKGTLKSMSKMTQILKTEILKNKEVTVRYFKSAYQKVFKIQEHTLAIELIHLAVWAYKKEESFNQALLEFPNYALAYQLQGLEDSFELDEDSPKRRHVQVTEGVGQLQQQKAEPRPGDFVQRSQKDDLIEDSQDSKDDSTDSQSIFIGMESKIQFKRVDLILNTEPNSIFLDFDILRTTQKERPELIVLLIENFQNKSESEGVQHITMRPDQVIEDCFALQKFMSNYCKNEFSWCLKYECANFTTDPLNLKMPIKYLPIHWLVLKAHVEIFSAPNTLQTFSQSPRLEDTEESKMLHSYKSVRNMEEQKIDKFQQYPKFYSYQEFKLAKVEGRHRNQVLVGIDYFDIYYQHDAKQPPKRDYPWLRRVLKFVLIENQSEIKMWRIPLSRVVQATLDSNQMMRITYEKEPNLQTTVIFTNVQHQEQKQLDQSIKSVQEAFEKLQFLIQQRIVYSGY